MQHALHLTQWFYFPVLIFFFQKSWSVADLPSVYLHKFVVERAMYLFVCREKRDLASTLWQPDITASLTYAKGGRSTCAVDTFFFWILLHFIEPEILWSWVCWDEIPTHLPDLKHGRSKTKRKLDFMGLWPRNTSACNGPELCEVCETALTRRGRGFNLCSRSHKSPSRGWKMSSNSMAVKSTCYAGLRKQQHWK